jgi:HPt (histidine-containing phosphotransfer) domain-containing protein
MDEYVSKPISSDTFFKAIQALVPVEVPDVPKPQVDSAFDKEALLSAFDHDWDFFKEAVDMFVADYRPMMSAIQEALKTKDAENLRRTAHALKGIVGNFQAKAAGRTAFNLEEMGRRKEFSGVDQEYGKLTEELADLEKTLLDLVEKGAF